MGLDASVMCNCCRDGKTTPPPFPRDWLELDQEGYINLKQEYDHEETWAKHYEWEQTCCEHASMEFASERIANWTGYGQFREALGKVGWQHFPILREQLPNANGGLMPAAACAKALVELDYFDAAGEIGMKTVLVATASGDSLHEYVPSYEGVFMLLGSRKINVGIGEYDFFAVNTVTGEDLFRATRFRQYNMSGLVICGDSGELIWENLDTGEIYESGIAIKRQIPWDDGSWQRPGGECRYEYPSEFHVEQQPRHVAEFSYIVKALRTVFLASVETGNPVRWC
jgi:hypothetical protein